MFLCGTDFVAPEFIHFIRNKASGIQLGKEVEQFVGCTQHCDVCLAACEHLVKEVGESGDESHLVIGLANLSDGLLELVLQFLRHIGTLSVLRGVDAGFEVHNDLGTGLIAIEYLREFRVCFVSCAKIEDMQVTERHPVFGKTSSLITHTDSQRAVGYFGCTEVLVAACVEGNRTAVP